MRKKFLLVAFSLVLFACQSENAVTKTEKSSSKPAIFSGNVMTIDYKVMVGEKINPEQEHQIEGIINQTFTDVDRIYNKWNPSSEVSRLNRMRGHVKANISPELEHLLDLTNRVVNASRGKFDPTIEPVQQLWKQRLADNQRPSQQEILRLKSAVGWDKVHFDKGIFYKDHDLTSLDLGGIAKGLAVDLLVEKLEKAGFINVYVEWGGEIKTSGHHPEGRPWNVAISRFGEKDPSQAIAQIALNGLAVATSGDYEQYWTINDDTGSETYFHVINPQTCEPLKILPQRVASVTVCAKSCAFADGLATVGLMFDSIEEASRWADEVKKEYPETVFWLSTRREAQ